MLYPSEKEDHTEEESHPLVEELNDRGEIIVRTRSSSNRPNVWMLTTFLLTFLLLASVIRQFLLGTQNTPQHYGYETGFETDWTPAREAIRTKKVKFGGGIQFDDNEERIITPNPDGITYTGPPTQDIDDAWYNLSHNVTIAVTPEEAKAVSDRSAYDKFRGHYTIGLSVLHSLHCLNAIRISRHVDHYREKGYPEEWWMDFHIEHCINHLRQVIMCHGDLTPTPLVPASKKPENKGWVTPDFDIVHTCRDFSAIREWSTEKHESGLRKAEAALDKDAPLK